MIDVIRSARVVARMKKKPAAEPKPYQTKPNRACFQEKP